MAITPILDKALGHVKIQRLEELYPLGSLDSSFMMIKFLDR